MEKKLTTYRHKVDPPIAESAASAHSQRGQMLIESMIALAVLTIGFLSVLTLLSRSIGLNKVVSDNYVAAYLASEGIEVMRNLSDSNFNKGVPIQSGICRIRPGAPAYDKLTYLTTNVGQLSYIGDDPKRSEAPLSIDSNGMYQYVNGPLTQFRRTIVIRCPVAGEIQVNSIVDWVTRGGATFSVNLEDHFLDWRPVF